MSKNVTLYDLRWALARARSASSGTVTVAIPIATVDVYTVATLAPRSQVGALLQYYPWF